MATLQAATTSTGAIVSNQVAVRELCENYCFGTLDWEITEEGEFPIWGYDDFRVAVARRAISTAEPRTSFRNSSE